MSNVVRSDRCLERVHSPDHSQEKRVFSKIAKIWPFCWSELIEGG